MGDRCDIRITMRRSDIVRFSEAVGYDNWWNQAEDADGNDIEIGNPEPEESYADGMPKDSVVTLCAEEVNYGWYDELCAAATSGVPFYGTHGSGGCYGAAMFASDGKDYDDRAINGDGDVFISYDLNTLLPILGDRDIEDLREFRDFYNSAVELVDAAGKKGD